MSETIHHIREFEGTRNPDSYGTESGFEVVTDAQIITLAIYDQQSCCEDFGYFMTEDDTAKFIGADLFDVKITDTDRSGKNMREGMYDGDVMFVDIVTSRGTLQFVAYNHHNGYYGHTARVKSKQVEHSQVL